MLGRNFIKTNKYDNPVYAFSIKYVHTYLHKNATCFIQVQYLKHQCFGINKMKTNLNPKYLKKIVFV